MRCRAGLRFYCCAAIVVIGILYAARKILRSTSKENDVGIDFGSFDNVSGSSEPIIPNVVHFFRLKNHVLKFTEMINVIAAWCHQRPDKIIIHCDCDALRGHYWDVIKDLPSIEVHRVKAPTAVFGRPFSSFYHAADILRLDVLSHYGGIALDFDVYIVRSLDEFRRFELALGWPVGANIGTQVIMAHPTARFLRMWIDSYRYYRPELWYYNAGQLPTQMLEKQPNLVHRVPKTFGVHFLISELYKMTWPQWRKYHAIHLLTRHRSYLDKNSSIAEFDENNILSYPYTYGDMVRQLLYGSSETRNANDTGLWKFRECRG